MHGLHSLSIGQYNGDAVLGGDFVGAGLVRANEVDSATRVYNVLAVVG